MDKSKNHQSSWPESSNIEVHWKHVEQALGDLCVAWTKGHFVPVYEADMAAYLYYLFVSGLGGNSGWFHLNTPINGGPKNKYFDLAIGTVFSTSEQKMVLLEDTGTQIPDEIRNYIQSRSSNSDFPPSVKATIILEFKHFKRRINPRSVNKDISKLSLLKTVCPKGRAIILFFDYRLLRENYLRSIANPDDPDMRIYVCTNDKSGQQPWRRLQ